MFYNKRIKEILQKCNDYIEKNVKIQNMEQLAILMYMQWIVPLLCHSNRGIGAESLRN